MLAMPEHFLIKTNKDMPEHFLIETNKDTNGDDYNTGPKREAVDDDDAVPKSWTNADADLIQTGIEALKIIKSRKQNFIKFRSGNRSPQKCKGDNVCDDLKLCIFCADLHDK